MRKKLKIITLLMLMTSVMSLYAQENHWTAVDQGEYSSTMSIIAVVKYDGEIQNRGDIELGVFFGEVCRYSGRAVDYDLGYHLFMPNFYGKNGEKFTIKIYDHHTGEEKSYYRIIDEYGNVEKDMELTFVEEGSLGNLFQPYSFDFIDPPYYIPDYELDQSTMSILAIVKIDGVEQANPDLELGAFAGDVVKGTARFDLESPFQPGRYLAQMNISVKDGASLSFKLYDHGAKEELLFTDREYKVLYNGVEIDEVPYLANAILGSPDRPVEINFITPYFVRESEDERYAHRTLAEAVTAAKDNDIITLVKSDSELCSSDDIDIDKNFTLDFNGKLYDFASYGLNVSSALTIKGTPENYSIPFIKLSGAGQVINETSFNTTIKKDFAGYGTSPDEGDQWHTISSPVGTVNVANVQNLVSAGYDLYQYDEPTMYWQTYNGTGNGTQFQIVNSRGYLYARQNDVTLGFTGSLSTEDGSIELSYTEGKALAGFNLIGNPYSHNISFAHLSGPELVQGYYVLSNEGSWGAVLGNGEADIIAPCQGALIKTTATGTLTISKNVNTRGAKSESNGSIAVSLSNERYSDITYVSFSEGEGLVKINHHNVNAPMLYIPVNNTNYAIATMSQDVTEVPVSLDVKSMGEYTISAKQKDCEYEVMTLVDKMTGVETNLLLEDYTFIATTKDRSDRFVIKLSNDNDDMTGNDNFAIVGKDNIIINNVNGHGLVKIFDVIGRPIAEYNVFESAMFSTSTFNSGVYFIQMSDENGVKVQKVIID